MSRTELSHYFDKKSWEQLIESNFEKERFETISEKLMEMIKASAIHLFKEVSTMMLLERLSHLEKNICVLCEDSAYMVIADNMIAYEKITDLKRGNQKIEMLHHNGRSFTGSFH
jgi:hypothetical protein